MESRKKIVVVVVVEGGEGFPPHHVNEAERDKNSCMHKLVESFSNSLSLNLKSTDGSARVRNLLVSLSLCTDYTTHEHARGRSVHHSSGNSIRSRNVFSVLNFTYRYS